MTLGALLALLLGNLLAQALRGIWNVEAGGAPDFVAFAGAARLLADGSHCLYCTASLAHAESLYLGRPLNAGEVGLFLNPPIAALLLIPIASLPEVLGFSIFVAVAAIALGAAAWILIRRVGCPPVPTLLAAAAVPGSFALAVGQWAPLLTLALAAALWQLRIRPVLAGCLLSLLLIKPQSLWLLPLGLVATRRWKVLGGLALGTLAQFGISITLVGISGCVAWVSSVVGVGTPQLAGSSSLPGLAGLLLGPGAGLGTVVVGAVLVILAIVAFRDHLLTVPELTVAWLVSLSLLLSPHVGGADLSLLFPAVAIAARRVPMLAVSAALVFSAAFLTDLGYLTADTFPGVIGGVAVAAVATAGLFARKGAAPLYAAPAATTTPQFRAGGSAR